jgi:RES domain-containing protein
LQFWRIARQRYAATALTGYGAAQRGGRWNSRGVPIVYASPSRALALLEILAHVDREDVPTDLMFTRLTLPDDALHYATELPSDWDVSPPPASARAFGDAWKLEADSLALIVPSAVLPQEVNVLINPSHARFNEVLVEDDGPVRIDPRLL